MIASCTQKKIHLKDYEKIMIKRDRIDKKNPEKGIDITLLRTHEC